MPLTSASADAVGHLDETIAAYLGFRRDTGDHLKQALAADPEFAMGHIVRGAFLKLFANRALDGRIADALAAARRSIEQRGGTRRERDHVEALAAWHRDDPLAALDRWEAILLDNPLDVLALKLANYVYFYLGDARNVRDSVARVLYAWNEETPGHGYVLGMYAFGLEECGDYANAEAVGQQAVEINPADVWAIHAVTHVLEMQGRHREGTDWLKTSEKTWNACNNFSYHLWWHGALFLMELERFHAVLDGYDSRIRADESEDYLDIANAASLLWRLGEAGIDVGRRWEELAEKAAKRSGDHALAFADAHYMMALAAAGRDDEAEAMLASQADFAAARGDLTGRIAGEVARPLCAALLAYGRGDYDGTVELLEPIRYDLGLVGGSRAQRDVFHRTLVTASIKAGRLNLARALLSERSADRPTSIWNWRTYARVLAALDDEDGAVAAWRKARDLLVGLGL